VAIVGSAGGPVVEDAFEAAFAQFAEVDRDLNEWEEGSALWRVNAGAGGPPVAAPPELCEVVRQALAGASRTGGLFDPSWAALGNLWKFGDGQTFTVPTTAEIEARCSKVGWAKVVVSPKADRSCTIGLAPGMRLGLGGIAKGWAIDQAVAALRSRGLKDFYLQAGGDLYFGGRRGATPWKTGIRDPRGEPSSVLATTTVEDAAFSTSGDYEHFAIVDGIRYHHIIDPRTCRPAGASRSATVLSPTATMAEILTKAIFITGGDAGLKMAEAQGASAVIVDSAGGLHVSAAIRPHLEM
jgi:thiamine biosynthesis lipoprotein